ncbi:MAG: LysR family transcriptional regulator ArgP [Pseudomonadota bacterium]
MDLLHPQLAAFAAVIDEGSFEAAAQSLAVTPSAVSQRIRALENRLGQLLIVRKSPCKATAMGERLLRHVRPMQDLEAEALAEIVPQSAAVKTAPRVAIAVNDDSLQTWIIEGLSGIHRDTGLTFDIRVDDQDHTLDLLRDGTVLGAVTSEQAPLPGCNVYPLGALRYLAIASPAFITRHFSGGLNAHAFNAAPMIVFNRKDALQWQFVRRVTRARINPPIHYLPTSTGFVEAAALGLGWCLAPEQLVRAAIDEERVGLLDHTRWVDVALFWQQTAIKSKSMDEVGRGLRSAARAVLRVSGDRRR